MDPQTHTITLSNQQTINYLQVNDSSSQAVAVLLIHGNFSDLSWWHETVRNIQHSGHRIVVPDLRGFGDSTYNQMCHRFGDWARDLLELLERLTIKKVVAVGWSFGGAVCMKLAQLAPDLVVGLLLTCSVPAEGLATRGHDGSIPRSQHEIKKIPKIAAALEILGSNNILAMRGIFQTLLFGQMQKTALERKDELVMSPFKQRCYLQLLEALANSDIDPEAIKAKTLFIHGKQDCIIAVKLLESSCPKIGKLEIWEQHGHMIPIEDPARYAGALLNFLQLFQHS